jgi:hypothetical protein
MGWLVGKASTRRYRAPAFFASTARAATTAR